MGEKWKFEKVINKFSLTAKRVERGLKGDFNTFVYR